MKLSEKVLLIVSTLECIRMQREDHPGAPGAAYMKAADCNLVTLLKTFGIDPGERAADLETIKILLDNKAAL